MGIFLQHIYFYGVPASAAFAVFVAVFAYVSVVDARTRTIPNASLLICTVAWVLAAGWAGCAGLLPAVWGAGPHDTFGTLFAKGLLGACCMFACSFGGAVLMKRITREESLGMGDVKLLTVIGLYMGPALACAALALACMVALAVCAFAGRRTFPFAPYLFIGCVIACFFSCVT